MSKLVILEIASLYALIGLVPGGDAPVDWIEEVRAKSAHLGVDVAYGSGSYSFINGDLGAEDDEIAKFIAQHLNDNGLFNTFDEAEAFMALHQRALEHGVNLETLDDAMPIDLWEDRALLGLRRRLRG